MNPYLSYGIGCSSNYLSDGCQSTRVTLSYFNTHEGGLAIQLGTPFLFTYSAATRSQGGGVYGDSAYGATGLDQSTSFQLFELDGTPVQILAVPEPATLALMILPLSSLVAYRRMRRAE